MQKLLTLCLNSTNLRHGTIEEHLGHYLAAGWKITSLRTVGGEGGSGWAVIVLETDPSTRPAAAAMVPTIETPSSDAGKPVAPSNVPMRADTPLSAGQTALAFSQGRWWRAEIVADLGDQVRLHFPGWDAKWDINVPKVELQQDVPPV